MVLEVLVNPKKASGKPWEMFFIGVIYSLVGIALGYWVFRSYVSLVMVTFTSIAAVPFIHSAIKKEGEKKSVEGNILQKHGNVISMFTYLFLGFVTVFVLAFILLPQNILGEVFKAQLSAISSVRSVVTGNFFASLSTFGVILANNLKVLTFCLIFSLLYGAGAIFILSWNASVMGAAIGDLIRNGFSKTVGIPFSVITTSLAGYFAHGLPEMIAYFVGGLAGGIVSVSAMKDGFRSPKFKAASIDSLNLVAFAVIILILAGLVEIFISPGFFK